MIAERPLSKAANHPDLPGLPDILLRQTARKIGSSGGQPRFAGALGCLDKRQRHSAEIFAFVGVGARSGCISARLRHPQEILA